MVLQGSPATAFGDTGGPTSGELPSARRRAAADWAVGQWRWLVPVTVAAATAAWVFGVVSGRTQGEVRIGLILVGATLTAGRRGDAVVAAAAGQ